MNAPAIAEEGEDPGLVENAPVRDAVAKGVNVINEAGG